MKKILTAFFILLQLNGMAQEEINIVPIPVEVEPAQGYFTISRTTVIVARKKSLLKSAVFLNDYLRSSYGFTLRIVETGNPVLQKLSKKFKTIEVDINKAKQLRPSAYNMQVEENSILINGDDESGVFYGIQTLIQLLPVVKNKQQFRTGTGLIIPQLKIKDYPRFGYRGMHLDVARHFFPVASVKRYIDYLAYHKFNSFHWHLTDDQGWRIEISKYPLLTRVGSCRDQTLSGRFGSEVYDGKKYCGYYSKKEIREIVQYATERHINVIPEIDMPGHSLAALASYPTLGCTKGPYKVMETWGVAGEVLCAGNDSTYTFLQNVLDEIIELFPSRYIHIGGDECPKDRWKKCPVCQHRMKKEHLKNEHELQSYFIRRMEKHLNSKGKQIIGWDEILEGGLAPKATVMSWRGESGGIAAAKMNHYAIMTPETPLYFNHLQSKNEDSITQGGFNPLEIVYAYEPVPNELTAKQSKFILGAQGNVWTEYISNDKKLEYMIFPRMTALAEVLWSPKEKRSWASFDKRLPGITNRYKLWKANYSNAYYDLQSAVIPLEGKRVGWKLQARDTSGRIIYIKDSSAGTTYPYTGPIPITSTGVYGSALENEQHRIISNFVWQHFNINKVTAKNISLAAAPNKSYQGSGAFSLVDGVQNTKGMLKSAEFLGFLGKDLDALIDLDSIQHFNSISLHAFEQTGSWIYRPASVSFYTSRDGINFDLQETITTVQGKRNLLYRMNKPVTARYIRILAKNYGIIPSGLPGSGTSAWLFADEIEVN